MRIVSGRTLITNDVELLHMDSDDSDQTARMHISDGTFSYVAPHFGEEEYLLLQWDLYGWLPLNPL